MATKDITDKQVVVAYHRREFRPGWAWPHEMLAAETGEALKCCWRACERANRRGFIEYGVSLRAGWITQTGRALLEGP